MPCLAQQSPQINPNMSQNTANNVRKARLPEVSEWFARRRLPYPDHLDAWLESNAFGTVERLKLVDDAEWRRLLQRSKEPCKKGDFRVFKVSIVALRHIPFDELHDWRRDALPELPLAVFGHIGRFLALGKQTRLADSRLVKKAKEGKPNYTARVKDLPSEIMNLCIAGGKAVADTVRFAYLHNNKNYLHDAILPLRWKRIQRWMKENDWTDLVDSRPITPHANFGRITLERAEIPPPFAIERTSEGTYTYIEYEDPQMTTIRRRVDDLLFYGTERIYSGETEKRITLQIGNILRHEDITISFLNDPYSIFSDPVVAISLSLTSVLKYLIETKGVDVNARFQAQWDASTSDDAEKYPLLYYALFESSTYYCFDYLITQPNLDCSATFIVKRNEWRDDNIVEKRVPTNVLFEMIGRRMIRQLRSLLAHPQAPDVNGKNENGLTALQVLCQVDDDYPYYDTNDAREIRVLLEHGADPMVKAPDENGALLSSVEHVYRYGQWEPDEENEEDDSDYDPRSQIIILQEIVWLLERYGEGGKRSADQPPITNFFAASKKQKRLK